MSASRPIDEFRDEWLSAYVDGELTPEERSAVEERLRTDPTAQRLLSELRRTSEAVQALPRALLGRDLRPTVLAEAARRRAAVEPASTLAARPAEPVRRMSRARTWGWAAAAVAAALLLMALVPGDAGDDRQVAVAPGEKDAAGGAAGVEAAVEGRAPSTTGVPTTSAAAPGADRGAGEMKATPSASVRSAVESSSARRDSDRRFLPTPAAPASADHRQVRRIDVVVAAADAADRFARLLAEQDVELRDADPPADASAALAEIGDGVVDAVLVEASAERIDALLAAIRADDESFAGAAEAGPAPAAAAAELAAAATVQPDAEGPSPGVAWRLTRDAIMVDSGAAADSAPTGGRVRALFVLRRDAAER